MELHDKVKHISLSGLMTVGLSLFMKPRYAAFTSFAVGMGKEILYDKILGNGKPDFADVVANGIGCAAGYGVSKMGKKVIKLR